MSAIAPKPGGTGLSCQLRGRSAVAPLAHGACHGLRVASCISSRKASVAATRDLFRGSLTVADVEKSCAFYRRVLGMRVVVFGGGRKALAFGRQKINLHAHGSEFEPKADRPTPGSADLCFITDVPLTEVVAHLNAEGVAIVEGPVERTGAA